MNKNNDTITDTQDISCEGMFNMGIKRKDSMSDTHHSEKCFKASDLVDMKEEKTNWIIPAILPQGLTILGGRQKVGKSWIALQIALAVGSGSPVLSCNDVAMGDVLYLALEDNRNRLSRRIKLLREARFSSRVTFITDCPPINGCRTEEGNGLDVIKNWIRKAIAPKLVIIDTLKLFTGRRTGGNYDIYGEDYFMLRDIKKVADKNNLAILLLHHLRKDGAEDYTDKITGSVGITGAVDTIWVMDRQRSSNEAVLNVTGRDVEETAYLLKSEDGINWDITGDADEVKMSEERKEILAVFEEFKEPLSAKEVTEVLGKNSNTVRYLINKLWHSDYLQRTAHGRYRLVTKTVAGLSFE